MTQLSSKDINALAQHPSVEQRGILAAKIASDFRSHYFTEAEETLALDIFRTLLREANITISAAIAEQLADCPNVPRDIILKLAYEPVAVSAPVLKYSPVLTEDDLIAIVHSTNEVVKLCMIAGRPHVSEALASSLLETSHVMVLQNLLQNKGAMIRESDMTKSWGVITNTPTLLALLVERGGLSLTIVEKIYHISTGYIRTILQMEYGLETPKFDKAADDAREWAVLSLTTEEVIDNIDNEQQVEDLIEALHANGRLTTSLLMRAICAGKIGIFECGIAKMADVPRINARILLLEATGLGFRAIYDAASMPEGFYEAVKVLLQLSLEETGFGHNQCADFRKRILERIYAGKYHQSVENMEYVVAIINGKHHANLH